jgi:hypothetical protein
LRDAAQRVGVVERALQFGVEDRVEVAGSWRPVSPTCC